MTQPAAAGPLDEQDVAALEALLAPRIGQGGMPLETLDGFFSALIVGPGELVMPREYLPYVFGEVPAWADQRQASEEMGLLTKLWNHIAWRVVQPLPYEDELPAPDASDDGFELMPLIALPDTGDEDGDDADPFDAIPPDFPVGALWAGGFLHGMSLRGDAWEAWMATDDDLCADVADLVRLSATDDAHADELGIPPQDRLDLDARWDLLTSVPGLLLDLNETRLAERVVRTPVRRAPAPGRNDPCPCGSGRKWKKCCGASVH
ncbi:UPF0149 family protein [Luteimonas sp. BDR2-5]|uniref:UPF0149 family protein n=1 Tax=Proluteimonas luteida TaxID=2878685 RepID=UPI001E61072A|nr:UPF0149 family protein [Luteimonas sp. BDR2-5]MCD9027491.1 UPF0149 family protein [Luteimonas sp. BDR2-5]